MHHSSDNIRSLPGSFREFFREERLSIHSYPAFSKELFSIDQTSLLEQFTGLKESEAVESDDFVHP